MKNNIALVVVDVQNEYFTGALPITYPENTFPKILSAIDIAHEHNMPVILVQHISSSPNAATFKPSSFEVAIHGDVLAKGYDMIIEKNKASSFHQTTLEDYLKANGIDTIAIAGYMTQMCCDTTARHASHLGYKVKFLSDATGTLDFKTPVGFISAEELHKATLATQSLFFSEVLSLDKWRESFIALT